MAGWESARPEVLQGADLEVEDLLGRGWGGGSPTWVEEEEPVREGTSARRRSRWGGGPSGRLEA